ncbi:MAG: hypothetical protein V7636_866 [Actinomycetota bacterium]
MTDLRDIDTPPTEAPSTPPTDTVVISGDPESYSDTVSPESLKDDPRWVRPAVGVLLLSTAVLYLWSLSDSGWANAFYSAAVQAASHSWKAFFFGSSDSSSFITVDKSPLFLWPMAISARIFGVNSWSILVPEALEGVAAVGVLYLAVKRWFGPTAGLLAGAVMALTPVAALMFRFDNPDAMLTLLLALGAYSIVRAVDDGSTKWVVLAGTFVGLGFLAKMLQALLVLPAFGLTYLVAAPVALRTRIEQLLLGAAAMVAAAGWWVAIVELWPKSSRPYIGGSQHNSVLELIFGYNGFGRLTGNENGSVGGGPGGTSGRWGATGIGRLFNTDYGGQVSWLLPAALLLLVAILAITWRAPRTDRLRAAAMLWGGWLVVTGLAVSLGEGIIHSYYTIVLAPAIGALVAIGAAALWQRRRSLFARGALAVTIAVTAWWAHVLFRRTSWNRSLGDVALVAGIAAAIAIVVWAWNRTAVAAATAAAAIAATMLGPVTYTWATVTTPHAGALPAAGPAGAGGSFGGGRGPGGARLGQRFAGGQTPFAAPRGGGASPRLVAPPRGFQAFRGGNGAPGGIGGILEATTPSDAVVEALEENASSYRWVAAVVSANQAAGYQLASDKPVMAIGGFNGTDPSPTLDEFKALVAAGKIHWFIAGGGGGGGVRGAIGGGGPAGANDESSTSSAITSWVTSSFTATTIGGTTMYDLSSAGALS